MSVGQEPASNRSKIISFKPGEMFQGKYRILSVDTEDNLTTATPLGEGGSGAVFLAEQDLVPGVAVKRALKFFVYRDDIAEMTKHQMSGPISATQFQDELVNLSSFNHENILKVIEAGIATRGGLAVPFTVTEFIEGPTLKKVIDGGLLATILNGDVALAVELVLQLCKGVAHLHSHHFFHCDIAPKNVFVKGTYPDLQIVLGDLGIGRSKGIKPDTQFFLIGTKGYCPRAVRELLYQEVTQDHFYLTTSVGHLCFDKDML